MFPLKCIKMAESGGTGIVLFPPTEAVNIIFIYNKILYIL